MRRELEHDPRWPRIARFVRGGFWRNFKVKYPEADEMYSRMMMVSRRLQAADRRRRTRRAGRAGPHGAVSRPVQLRLLARRVRRRLSAALAQCRLSAADRGRQPARPGRRTSPRRWVEADGRRFQFRRPAGSPAGQRQAGGAGRAQPRRACCTSSTSARSATTCWPRSPAGPRRITARCWPAPTAATTWPASAIAWSSSKPGSTSGCNTTTIRARACSIISTIRDATLAAVAAGEAAERGDFLPRPYEARLRRNPEPHPGAAARAKGMRRRRAGADHQGRDARSRQLDAGNRLPARRPAAGPAAALRRRVQFRRPARRAPTIATSTASRRQRLGQLGTRLDLADAQRAGPGRRMAGHRREPGASRAARASGPSRSKPSANRKAGFELVHQSVVVLPHWIVQGDADGRWSVVMHLAIDTSLAESRLERAGPSRIDV